MTPRMTEFLKKAATAPWGKGIPVEKYDMRIAHKACREGYGWMITAPLRVFIIEQSGRLAIGDHRYE